MVVLSAGAALLAVLFAELGPARILALLSALGANFLIIVALFGCHECVRALAVGRCFPVEQRPRFRTVLRVRFIGEAVGTLTRTGMFSAEPARAWMLAGQTAAGSHGYAAAAGELIANSCTSASVSVVVTGYLLLAGDVHGPIRVVCHVLLWGSLVYVSAAAWALFARVYLISAIVRGVGALPLIGRRLTIDRARVRDVENAIIHALTDRPAALVRILLLECVAQSILISEIYWTIHSMGIPIDPWTAVKVEVLTKASNIVQVIGVMEAGYSVLFTWLGMTAVVGFTLSLVKLLRSLAAAGLGLAILKGLAALPVRGELAPPADRPVNELTEFDRSRAT